MRARMIAVVRPLARRCWRRICDEDGSVTVWMLLWTPVLVLCLGLIVDYGAAIQARALASDVAVGAARAGAVEVVSVTGEGARIDPAAALAAASAYVADSRRGAPDRVSLRATYQVAGDSVEVTVTATYEPRILDSMTGTFTRTERAELQVGQ